MNKTVAACFALGFLSSACNKRGPVHRPGTPTPADEAAASGHQGNEVCNRHEVAAHFAAGVNPATLEAAEDKGLLPVAFSLQQEVRPRPPALPLEGVVIR